jgi:hypothetical protein
VHAKSVEAMRAHPRGAGSADQAPGGLVRLGRGQPRPALWSSLDDNGRRAWVQVLFQKLMINDRGKVVDGLLNHPLRRDPRIHEGRSNSVRLSSP